MSLPPSCMFHWAMSMEKAYPNKWGLSMRLDVLGMLLRVQSYCFQISRPSQWIETQRTQTLGRIAAIVKGLYGNSYHPALFGSSGYGVSDPRSDLDVVILVCGSPCICILTTAYRLDRTNTGHTASPQKSRITPYLVNINPELLLLCLREASDIYNLKYGHHITSPFVFLNPV